MFDRFHFALTASIIAAKRWRQEDGYVGRGGVVVVFDGIVNGWVNRLRNPERWRPGCVAVDENEQSWTAIAGNDQSGALMWLPNDLIPE